MYLASCGCHSACRACPIGRSVGVGDLSQVAGRVQVEDGRAAGAVLGLPLAGVGLDQVDPRPERVSVSLKPLCSLPSSCWSTVIVPSFSSVTFVSVPFSS
jgi:hypothetical protein